MAKYRGKVAHTTTGAPLNYEVAQYKMVDNPRLYVRGATEERLNSSQVEWVRIRVWSADPTQDKYMQLWGPFLARDVIEGEMEAAFDDPDYLEAIGA